MAARRTVCTRRPWRPLLFCSSSRSSSNSSRLWLSLASSSASSSSSSPLQREVLRCSQHRTSNALRRVNECESRIEREGVAVHVVLVLSLSPSFYRSVRLFPSVRFANRPSSRVLLATTTLTATTFTSSVLGSGPFECRCAWRPGPVSVVLFSPVCAP